MDFLDIINNFVSKLTGKKPTDPRLRDAKPNIIGDPSQIKVIDKGNTLTSKTSMEQDKPFLDKGLEKTGPNSWRVPTQAGDMPVPSQRPLQAPVEYAPEQPMPDLAQHPSGDFQFNFNGVPRDPYYANNKVSYVTGKDKNGKDIISSNRPGFNPNQPPTNIGEIIRKHFPNEATTAGIVAATENGQYDPRRPDNINPSDGSADRGIFQINSNTFNGLTQRRKDELKKIGVNSFEDMYDPDKNAAVARMIKDEGGWGRWFGWQSTGYKLNPDNLYSQPVRQLYELEQLKKRKK